jgi:hypothetical protein
MTTSTAGKRPVAASSITKAPAKQTKHGKREPLQVLEYRDMRTLFAMLCRKFRRRQRFSVTEVVNYLLSLPSEKLDLWDDFSQQELPDAVAIGCEELRKGGYLKPFKQASREVSYALLQN